MRTSVRKMLQAGVKPGLKVWVHYERSKRVFPGVIKKLLPGWKLAIIIERADGSHLYQVVSKDWVTLRE